MKELFLRRRFLVGLLLRLLFLGYLSSGVMAELFIPFIDGFLKNPTWNPWAQFPSHFFPYGSYLLIPLALSKGIFAAFFSDFSFGSTWLSFVAMKLPLLFFDLGLLCVLEKMSVSSRDSILKYYWLNPILLFITYVHGQLDIVPIYFSILSIYFLIQKRYLPSAVFMAFANVSKLNTLVLVPLLLAYIWNTHFFQKALRQLGQWLGVYSGILFLGFLPQIISWKSVGAMSQDWKLGHHEALKIFSFVIPFDSTKVLFIGFLCVMILLIRLSLSSRISAQGLFYGCGVLLASILVVTPAMPGWYFWFFPFVALFYSNYSLPPRSIYWSSCLLYLLLHFCLPWIALDDELARYVYGGVFSLLQVTIVLLCLAIWFFVLRFEAPLDRRIRPLVFGLAGDSGSGKNHITTVIQDLFGESSVSLVEGDDYHKWERGDSQWQDYTHLDPKANFLDHMSFHTQSLLSGKLIEHHHYDHSTGKFSDPRSILSKKILILQGLHSFYQKSLRQNLDIKVFLNPDEELRIAWKVLRDVHQRGYQYDRVMTTIQARKEDFSRHIEPQKSFADWVIESKMKDHTVIDYRSLQSPPEFYVQHVVWNDTPLSDIAYHLEQVSSARLVRTLRDKNIDQVNVVFYGTATSEQIQTVAERAFPCLRQLTQARVAPVFHSGNDGFSQLICLALIQRGQSQRRID